MSDRSIEWVPIDDEWREHLHREAPELLERRGAVWLGGQRRLALEHVVIATVSLFGLFVLDWPAAVMLLFLLLNLWVSLLTDALRLALSPWYVRAAIDQAHEDDNLWLMIQALRRGEDRSMQARRFPGGPALQLGLAAWIALSVTGSLLYELSRIDGPGLWTQMWAHPDMLLMMGVGLVAQLIQALWLSLRQEPDLRRTTLIGFSPMVDGIIFMIVMFFWLVIGAIVLKLGEIYGGIDPLGTTLTVFVAASYGVLLFRGVGEWQVVRGDRELGEWFRQVVRDGTLHSPNAARRGG